MKLSCTTILNIFVLTGCMVSFMLRMNMVITVVVIPDLGGTQNTTANATVNNNSTNSETNSTNSATNATNSATNSTQVVSEGTLDPWKQNMILGCFFWGYIVSEVPGGRMAETWGPRLVLGSSILVSSILTLITPTAASLAGYPGLVAVRVIIGLSLGAVFPSLYPLAARWVPPKKRSKFMSHMLALSLGSAMTYPLCGYLISWFGWTSVFYVTGAIGLLWTFGWFWFVSDSPGEHPRISSKERLKIEGQIGTSSTGKVLPVPWRSLLMSGPVWAAILTHTANVFCYSTISNQTPAYLKQVFYMNIKKNGIYSSLPQLGKYLFGVGTGFLVTWIKTRTEVTTLTLRRIFVIISMGIPTVLMLVLAHTGHSATWAVALLVAVLTLNGGVTGGHLCSGLDIAPNFSGTIFGLANTLGSLASFASSYFIGHLTYEKQTFYEWRIVFYLLAASYGFAVVCFMVLGSATIQEWNMPNIILQSDTEEGKPLKIIYFKTERNDT